LISKVAPAFTSKFLLMVAQSQRRITLSMRKKYAQPKQTKKNLSFHDVNFKKQLYNKNANLNAGA
jgi:hypothetical protein